MGRNNKIILEFDNTKRKEFLSGFHKRKTARRKKAQDEIEKALKEEKARIRKERQDAINSRLEEITNIKLAHDVEPVCIDLSTNVLDLPHHNVTIVESELFDPALNCYIGDNKEEDSDNDDLASSSEPQAEEAPRRRVNISKSMAMLEKMKRKNTSKKSKFPLNFPKKQSKATKKYLKKTKKKTKKQK